MRTITITAMLVLLAGLPTRATVQTPDGETPVNEGVCDELIGGTPGLYGLCVAFCEAQDLDLIDLGDPGSVKHGPSNGILERYRKMKQQGDPNMPCVQIPCPCWTQQELDGLRYPPAQSALCGKDSTFTRSTNVDFWRLFNANPRFDLLIGTGEANDKTLGRWCDFGDLCDDNNCLNVRRTFFNLTAAEFADCEVQVAESGAVRGFDCFIE